MKVLSLLCDRGGMGIFFTPKMGHFDVWSHFDVWTHFLTPTYFLRDFYNFFFVEKQLRDHVHFCQNKQIIKLDKIDKITHFWGKKDPHAPTVTQKW